MASQTETTLQAFVALLVAVATAPGAVIPQPMRNEMLDTRLPEFGSGSAWLNVLDGDAAGSSEGGAENVALGSSAGQFELRHECKVEWAYQHKAPTTRDSGFDAGLIAIYDAVTAEGAIEGVTVTLASLQRSNLNTEGMPQTKGALFTFALTFVSSRPF